MNLKEIKARIDDIREVAGDDETAHAREDELYADFIAFVAENPMSRGLADKAKLVLSTRDLKFERWCA